MWANNMVKGLIPKIIKAQLKDILHRDTFRSYSQYGEDAYLYAYFRGKTWENEMPMFLPKNGFYVDVGAYSPTECSNTHAFYKQGWSGINIDATPGVMSAFDHIRKRDINLNVAVGCKSRDVTFYSWGFPSVFNTADAELARQRALKLGKKPVEIRVKSFPLADLLEKYVPDNTKIDFLSVDVEGLDLEVLKSNNWDKYRPELVLVEDYSGSLIELQDSEIISYMTQKDYAAIAWLQPSIILRDMS